MVTAINFTAIIISAIALVAAIAAVILVLAQRWSTHKIEWRPLVTESIEIEVEKELEEVDEDEAEVLKEALKLQRKSKHKAIDPLDSILETNNF